MSIIERSLQSGKEQRIETARQMIRLKIAEIAREKNVSMKKLAKRSGLAYNTIRLIYRDPYRGIDLPTLDKLAKALQVDASELIESVPDPS